MDNTVWCSLLCAEFPGSSCHVEVNSGVSFSVIEDILISLNDSLKQQGKTVSEFYIDNCCAWRNKLQQVFGRELKVSLDIFHAVKRVSEKIPKRHRLRKECMHDWSMVFRDPTDHGVKRYKATPDPAILEANLDLFESCWKNAKYDDIPILNEAALKEICNIRKHITKGCLSGIAPGRGTNRNESLHKDLNNIMSSSRYGVELAYALFTICLFKHNLLMQKRGLLILLNFIRNPLLIKMCFQRDLAFRLNPENLLLLPLPHLIYPLI